jgi:ribonuclease Z
MRQLELATSWGALRLSGGSRAGEASLLLLPQLRLALDAGRLVRALVPMQHVVITHGHLDHLLGLPAWASQRCLQGMPGGVVYVPAALEHDVTELLGLCGHLEGGKPYDVEVRPVTCGERVKLRPGLELVFFATAHWVDSLGCRLEWQRRRLRPEYVDLDEADLRTRRAAGEQLTEEVRTHLLAYLGDTGPDVFEREPWLANVEVLVVECTFLSEQDRERARQFGHMHLGDLTLVAPRLRNRYVVLTHLSRRHRLGPGSAAIRRALAPLLGGELHLLNVEWE